MKWWLLTLPFISSFIGWLVFKIAIRSLFYPRFPINILGISFQGFFPKRQLQLAQKIALFVSKEFSLHLIEDKITSTESLEKIMPFVEGHVDTFLKVKLGEKMPMIKMFVGEKTLEQMKEIFLAELRELFPLLMKNYMGNLQQDLNVEQIVTEKIANFPIKKFESIVKESMKKEFKRAEILGTITGFIIGLINLFIVIVTS